MSQQRPNSREVWILLNIGAQWSTGGSWVVTFLIEKGTEGASLTRQTKVLTAARFLSQIINCETYDAAWTEDAHQPGLALSSRQGMSAAAEDSKPPLPSGHPVDISIADVPSELAGLEATAAGTVPHGFDADAGQALSAKQAGNEMSPDSRSHAFSSTLSTPTLTPNP